MYKCAAELQMSLTSDCPIDLVHIGIVFYWHAVPLILVATMKRCYSSCVVLPFSGLTALHTQFSCNMYNTQDNSA